MGYYSSFEVIDTDIPDALDALNALDPDGDCFELWHDTIHSYDNMKWYDWLTDLAELAKLYPDKYLVMERCGEESPDISRAVVKNGTVTEIEPELVWPSIQQYISPTGLCVRSSKAEHLIVTQEGEGSSPFGRAHRGGKDVFQVSFLDNTGFTS